MYMLLRFLAFKVKPVSILKEGRIRASKAQRGQLGTLGQPVGPLSRDGGSGGETIINHLVVSCMFVQIAGLAEFKEDLGEHAGRT